MELQRCESDRPGVGDAGWRLSLYPSAGEAGGSFRYSLSAPRGPRSGRADPARSAAEAARRARTKLRRYCAANRLNRLGTLTYAQVCADEVAFREHMGGFFRELRRRLGGEAFPYAWVPEWQQKRGSLHAHFAVGRYVPRSDIEAAWGRGFVHIKLLGDLPVGSGALTEARVASRYLAKYVGKDFGGRRAERLHRYELAQGFQPVAVPITGRSVEDVLGQASAQMGAHPERVWQSREAQRWEGPPAVWARWTVGT
jgi:hypothetical protein